MCENNEGHYYGSGHVDGVVFGDVLFGHTYPGRDERNEHVEVPSGRRVPSPLR